ncbi:histidinol dehydrogenase [Spirochaetota bacterium]|nr:histidinol dehydrogenase [Spirochaetota bacterium]
MKTTSLIPTFNLPADYKAALARLNIPPADPKHAHTTELAKTVRAIINRVRTEGDNALLHYTKTLDKLTTQAYKLRVTASDFECLTANPLDSALITAIETAITNIKTFHSKQTIEPIHHTGKLGEKLTLRPSPINAVALYIPGGTAGSTPLISTLIMNAIPAQLAGVKRLVVMTPPMPTGNLAPVLLYTLKRLGIDEIYKIGGAQAIAAGAYGTESIAPVDFISGPGNEYVTEAKRQVFGTVGIESLSGNSEIVVLSDGSSPTEHIASDLLSQAEHAGNEMVCLITTSLSHGKAVIGSIEKWLPQLSRKEIISKSLARRSALVIVKELREAHPFINALAPEHLELSVENPHDHLKAIHHAGAIFLGRWSSEPIGDYIAGCNHILPTSTSARFASPLTVQHFYKWTNVIDYTEDAFTAYAPHAARLAAAETLSAHKNALDIRTSSPPSD